MREAHLLSTLNHPNVLGYHESFLHDGSLCIVTHFCEEGDLFTLIR
jgi:NIMA (never in mitosis gene a)-related kinase